MDLMKSIHISDDVYQRILAIQQSYLGTVVSSATEVNLKREIDRVLRMGYEMRTITDERRFELHEPLTVMIRSFGFGEYEVCFVLSSVDAKNFCSSPGVVVVSTRS